MLHDPNAPPRPSRSVQPPRRSSASPTDAGASAAGRRWVRQPCASPSSPSASPISAISSTIAATSAPARGAHRQTAAKIDTLARRRQHRRLRKPQAGARPIFLGGDHSISMGSVAGVARHCRDQRPPLFVLWLDAHGDFNTPAHQRDRQHPRHVARHCSAASPISRPSATTWFAAVDPATSRSSAPARSIAPRSELIVSRGVDVVDMRTHRRVRRRRPCSAASSSASRSRQRPPPSLARCRCDGPRDRARRRHHRPRRPHLPRGAPDHGDAARLRVPSARSTSSSSTLSSTTPARAPSSWSISPPACSAGSIVERDAARPTARIHHPRSDSKRSTRALSLTAPKK